GDRSGTPQASFDAVGAFGNAAGCPGSDIVEGYKINRCIPPIREDMLENAQEKGWFNPFGQSGILFKLNVDTDPEEELIYGRFEGIDPLSPMEYYRWECLEGGWVKIEVANPIIIDAFDVLRGLYNMMFIDEKGFFGHLTLDILSVVPIIGIPADLASATWYIVEGDYTNASFALIGTIPLIGDGIQLIRNGTRLVLEAGGVVYDVRAVMRLKCLTGPSPVTFMNTGLLSSIYINSLPPCNLGPEFSLVINNLIKRGTEIMDEYQALTVAKLDALVLLLSRAVKGQDIAILIERNPHLLKAYAKAEDLNLAPVQIERMFEWLASARTVDDIPAFVNNPDLVIGWKFVDEIYGATNSGRKFDVHFMSKVTEMLEDAIFLERIAPAGSTIENQKQALIDIITKYRGKCRTCGDPNIGVAHLDHIDEYLQSLFEFAENFHQVPGFDIIMRDARTGGKTTIDAVAQQFRNAIENPTNIIQFESPLGNPLPPNILDNVVEGAEDIAADMHNISVGTLSNSNIGDVQRGVGNVVERLDELKSYRKSSLDFIENTNYNDKFVTQLKAYFDNLSVNSISNMNYIFDAKKLLLPDGFDDIESALRYLKGHVDDAGMLVQEGVFMKIFKPASQGGRGDEIFEVIY
ncbi:MAG: hypothetical protein AAGJ93_15475, partial [Bacteroidota bacterium]